MFRSVLAVTCLFAGCVAAPTRTAPDAASDVPVTVRVLTYFTELPITDAVILRDALPIGTTNAEGLFVFQVAVGTTIRVAATKNGYQQSVSAEGQVNGSNERWTFYLERDQGEQGPPVPAF